MPDMDTSKAPKFDLQPRLVGERIELRPLTPGDFEALHDAASDPGIWALHPEPTRHERDEAQKASLAAWFGKTDKERVKKTTALAQARQPLPIDPGLKALQDKLAYVSRPVVEDDKLVRLRKDVEQSAKQAANVRLTMAQDVAWSLINNSSFLFNR